MSGLVAVAPAAKVVKAKKPKAVKKASSHPSYQDMIQKAVVSLKDRSGSSRQAIQKFIQSNYKTCDDKVSQSHLKLALKRGVDGGALKRTKGTGASGSFRLSDKPAAQKTKKPAAKKAKKSVKAAVGGVVKKAVVAKKPKTALKAKKPAGAAKPKKASAEKKASAKPKVAKKPKTPKKAAASKVKKAKTPKAKKPAKAKAAKKPAAAKK